MKYSNNVIIGIMGGSCSGKTTTARILAERLGLNLQDEIESSLLRKWISEGIIKKKEDLIPELSRKFQSEALSIRERNISIHCSIIGLIWPSRRFKLSLTNLGLNLDIFVMMASWGFPYGARPIIFPSSPFLIPIYLQAALYKNPSDSSILFDHIFKMGSSFLPAQIEEEQYSP